MQGKLQTLNITNIPNPAISNIEIFFFVFFLNLCTMEYLNLLYISEVQTVIKKSILKLTSLLKPAKSAISYTNIIRNYSITLLIFNLISPLVPKKSIIISLMKKLNCVVDNFSSRSVPYEALKLNLSILCIMFYLITLDKAKLYKKRLLVNYGYFRALIVATCCEPQRFFHFLVDVISKAGPYNINKVDEFSNRSLGSRNTSLHRGQFWQFRHHCEER